MAHTSCGRIIAGGLLAGVVINVVELLVNGMLLMNLWAQAMQALGKPNAFSTAAIVTFNIVGFLIGIASVWLYAAIRPRYGAGVLTAMRAGIAVWFIGNFIPNLATYPMHLFRGRLLAIATMVGLAEILIASVLGAWVYKEEAAPAAKAATA